MDSFLDAENCAYLFEPSALVVAIEQMINAINSDHVLGVSVASRTWQADEDLELFSN